MSDTVAVALIAVGGTIGSGVLSYLASARNTSAQLAGIEVEMQRLDKTDAEKARQEQFEVYHDFLNTVEEFEDLVLGLKGAPNQEALLDGISVSSRSYSRLVLLGNEEVVVKAGHVNDAMLAFTQAASKADEENKELDFNDCVQIAVEKTHDDLANARNRMREAMRSDLARRQVIT